MEEIRPGLYKTDIPLPRNPLKSLNCYIIQGDGETLVIDTGFNCLECHQALFQSLNELAVRLDNTKVFVTHMHADHSGQVAELAGGGAEAYCNREDAETINAGEVPFLEMDVFARTGGFPAQLLQNAVKKHPGYKYRALEQVDFKILDDGELLSVGEYTFACIKTPGHTQGHTCLYEKDKKILIAGDHILKDITPNISLWSDSFDPLSDYLDSLDLISRLEVDLVLPGHRTIFADLAGRIKELKEHHQVRAAEVLHILNVQSQNAYEVAAKMTWDMTYDSFDQFPLAQKWFAASEALAHLKYLEEKGLVGRTTRDGVTIYFCR